MKSKLILVMFSIFCTATTYAGEACLNRPDDDNKKKLNVVSIVRGVDFKQPITLDSAFMTRDCVSNGCTFQKNNIFTFDWSSNTLIWIKGTTSTQIKMELVDDPKGKVVYLKSAPSTNSYIYYLMKTGAKNCELIDRYKGPDQAYYHGKSCSLYRIEAFEKSPSLAHQKIYIEPDDIEKREDGVSDRVTWGAPCSLFNQPGAGGGSEPPP